jgi:hypothetical protein
MNKAKVRHRIDQMSQSWFGVFEKKIYLDWIREWILVA